MDDALKFIPPCPRKCSDCRYSDHHWLEECDEDTGEPQMACKHCDATKPYDYDDVPDDAPLFPEAPE